MGSIGLVFCPDRSELYNQIVKSCNTPACPVTYLYLVFHRILDLTGLDLYPGPFVFRSGLFNMPTRIRSDLAGVKIYHAIKFQIMEIKQKNGSPEMTELEISTSHIIVEIIEYMANSVVTKTILKKSTGNISVMSFDTGEGLTEKTSPFDTFAQIIEGKAEIVIDGVSSLLGSGQGIIIPAHSPNFIKPNGRFKMILTIIKSGYA